jgi:solute carrier family 25 protein 39/40
MVGSRQNLPSWISAAAANRVDFEGNVSSMSETMLKEGSSSSSEKGLSDVDLGFGERAFSAAGAAVLSAILVNPLDVAKVFNFYDTHLLISSYFERFYIVICILFFPVF